MKAATGEIVSAEDLGGADVHCKYVSSYFSELLLGLLPLFSS